MKKNVLIIGAAGRDFHNFNTYYRGNEAYNVAAYTAAQIPDIADRKYPKELAGDLYPDGIPIYLEEELENLIKDLKVKGSVMASDAFFPFRDGIDAAAASGIEAVIQPGGSIRDQEVIDAANGHNMVMLFTGMRHFNH